MKKIAVVAAVIAYLIALFGYQSIFQRRIAFLVDVERNTIYQVILKPDLDRHDRWLPFNPFRPYFFGSVESAERLGDFDAAIRHELCAHAPSKKQREASVDHLLRTGEVLAAYAYQPDDCDELTEIIISRGQPSRSKLLGGGKILTYRPHILDRRQPASNVPVPLRVLAQRLEPDDWREGITTVDAIVVSHEYDLSRSGEPHHPTPTYTGIDSGLLIHGELASRIHPLLSF